MHPRSASTLPPCIWEAIDYSRHYGHMDYYRHHG